MILCVLPVAGGVLVGYLRGGRTVQLAGRFRALWLLWLAAVIQTLQYVLPAVRGFFDDRLHISLLWLVFAVVAGWVAVNVRGRDRQIRLGRDPEKRAGDRAHPSATS